jgi:hypothetical protein
MENVEQRPLAENDLLDDVFATSPSPGVSPRDAAGPLSSDEPSDLPSLRRQHVTAGYRDGVFFARNQHVQNGFDAGFPMGAQLGIRVGTVLGILEGVIKGFDKRGTSSSHSIQGQKTVDSSEGEQIRRLYAAAIKELSLESMFGGMDGNSAARGGNGDDKPEIQVTRKAEIMIKKWEKIVGVPKWEEIVGDHSVEQS